MTLIPVAEAQARILALADRLAIIDLPLEECAGRWLANDIVALRYQPWADLSAMDGYAITARDMPGPWRVVGESAAGDDRVPAIGTGEALRIFTGAPLPAGADSILIQENARRDGAALILGNAVNLIAGTHVRHQGSDFGKGTTLLTGGTPLTAGRISLAALAGHGALPVRRRARVALMSTGNELIPAGLPVPPGRLPSSNALMLRAMLHGLPCDIDDLGIITDDLDAVTAAFARAKGADIILSTGGASVGDHDLVRPGFQAAGGTLDFWKIRMRPGKPLIAGTLATGVFLGLPGNPVSAFVTATLFLLPLIRHMAGSDDPLPQLESAVLGSPIKATGERDEYLRARRVHGPAVALTAQDSAATLALSQADCLIVRQAGAPAASPGETVDILPLAF